MKKTFIRTEKTSLRFCRWSRKGYAAFISIHRQVTIGRLAAALVERFHLKQQTLHGTLALTNDICLAEGNTDKELLNKTMCLYWIRIEGKMCLVFCVYVLFAITLDVSYINKIELQISKGRQVFGRMLICLLLYKRI